MKVKTMLKAGAGCTREKSLGKCKQCCQERYAGMPEFDDCHDVCKAAFSK